MTASAKNIHILAVDDEPLSLHVLCEAISAVVPDGIIHAFEDAQSALAFAEEQPVDLAFLDIALGSADGITLAANLQQFTSTLNIIFVTGYEDYACDAMRMHASGYITKPVTKEKIEREVCDLRYPLSAGNARKNSEAEVRLHTFGEFQLFIGDEPVAFRYKRANELLALLTDRRGSFCSNSLIIETLWEQSADSDKNSYLRVLRQDLLKTLDRYGKKDIILQRRGEMALDIKQVSCDYYDYLKGDYSMPYTGEYMSQYSWAERTNAFLLRTANASSRASSFTESYPPPQRIR